MNIQVADDVEIVVLSAALKSMGLALIWQDGGPVISKEPVTPKPACSCGKPATVLADGRAFCSACFLGSRG